jgi:uncharacterized membrane protein YwzB
MTVTVLLVFLMAALSIVLHDRRITFRQFTWWAVQSIALCMFEIGRML